MRDQDGLTLIELLIVVVIIGILAGIAIPNFASVKTKSFDSAAKADLRNMIVSEENYFSELQAYADITVAAGGSGDLDGNGTEDFRASQGVTVEVTAYVDGFKVTSAHNASPNTWCVNSSSGALGAAGSIVKATNC